MRKWSLVLSLLLLFSGCASEQTKQPELLDPVGVTLDMVQVKREDIYQAEYYSGKVIPYVEELSFQIDGVISQMNVVAGQEVKKGQVLAALDQSEEEKRVEEAQRELDFQKKTANSQNAQLTCQIEIAQKELEKLKQENAAAGEQQLKQLEIEQLRSDLQYQKTQQQLNQKRLADKLASLRENLGNNQIVAPFDGRVVYLSQQFTQGSWIQSEQPLIYFADNTRLSVDCDLISAAEVENAHRVYAQIGTNQLDVTYVPLTTQDYLDSTLSEVELKTRFRLSGENVNVKSGDDARICVVSQYRADTLTVPVNAVYKDGGGSYVYLIDDDGKQQRITVKTGVRTSVKVEILEGLSEGDTVYVKD